MRRADEALVVCCPKGFATLRPKGLAMRHPKGLATRHDGDYGISGGIWNKIIRYIGKRCLDIGYCDNYNMRCKQQMCLQS